MEKRFIVKNLVSDYAVFDTEHLDEDHLVCICQGKRNADLIADILNTDYSKPNECTYYENKLLQENKELKEQVAEQIDYRDEYYHYWQETKKELAIREKSLELACESLCQNVDDEEEYYARIEDARNYFIEQAKESIDEDRKL